MALKSLIKAYLQLWSKPVREWRYPLFAQRYLEKLAQASESTTPLEFFGDMDPPFFFWTLVHSAELGQQANGLVPALPSPYHRRNWTGDAGEWTFRQAQAFQNLIERAAAQHLRKPLAKAEILDFGCGWGRILRFFLRSVPHTQLHGCDCWPEIVEVSRRDNRWCDFQAVPTLPATQYESGRFDLIYLYSVFSHLSEAAHLAWVQEFHRILQPGGIVVATTRGRDFLQRLAANREKQKSRGMRQSMLATDAFPNIDETFAAYDRGEFCYAPTGGGGPLDASFYGEAAVPAAWFRKHWDGFEILEVHPAKGVIDQLVVVARKK